MSTCTTGISISWNLHPKYDFSSYTQKTACSRVNALELMTYSSIIGIPSAIAVNHTTVTSPESLGYHRHSEIRMTKCCIRKKKKEGGGHGHPSKRECVCLYVDMCACVCAVRYKGEYSGGPAQHCGIGLVYKNTYEGQNMSKNMKRIRSYAVSGICTFYMENSSISL